MGTSATAPVTAPEDALRRACEVVARGAVGHLGPELVPREIARPVTPLGGTGASGPDRAGGRAVVEELLGTTCTAVPRGR